MTRLPHKATSCTIYLCPQCGSPEVEETAWVRVNTGEITSSGGDGPRDTFWCINCEEEIERLHEVESKLSHADALGNAAACAKAGVVHEPGETP